mmetsp:Transcript_58907/g.49890  ORF Transcript_58907/g.49890 Transcript_58907/m.49890 type:complete len:124 (+) Transcript_58907:302-673(+)
MHASSLGGASLLFDIQVLTTAPRQGVDAIIGSHHPKSWRVLTLRYAMEVLKLLDPGLHKLRRLAKPFLDRIPINDCPKAVNVLESLVFVIEIICMLPHIEGEQRKLALHHTRRVLIAGSLNRE